MIIIGVLAILTSLRVNASAPFPTVTELTVEFGDTVVLPCNSSYYIKQLNQEEMELSLRWDAMGEDVAYTWLGTVTEGQGYEGRVQFPPVERMLEGDFSLQLSKAVLSDSNMYECVWQGWKPISTVWVKVKDPIIPRASDVTVGSSLHIPCYGSIPKTMRSSQIYVEWNRNGLAIMTLSNSQFTAEEERYSMPNSLKMGDFSLYISPVLSEDQGEYQCFYKPRLFEGLKSGLPESFSLRVSGRPPFTDTESTPVDASTTSETTTAIGMLSDDVRGDSSVTSHKIEEQVEAVTSSPESDTEDGVDWEKLPWIRIGIIGGVLLVTALVLGILLASHKI